MNSHTDIAQNVRPIRMGRMAWVRVAAPVMVVLVSVLLLRLQVLATSGQSLPANADRVAASRSVSAEAPLAQVSASDASPQVARLAETGSDTFLSQFMGP